MKNIRTLQVSFQIDKQETFNIQTDSTTLLIQEACSRNHKIFCYNPEDLFLYKNNILAYGKHIEFSKTYNRLTFSQKILFDLKNTDILFIRQNPPFDMKYISATYILDLLPKRILMVNNSTGIRNHPEKFITTNFSGITPSTLISRNIKAVTNFINKYKKVIVKPLYEFGGRKIFTLKNDDINIHPILELFMNSSQEPFIVQKFIENRYDNDIRIIVLNGKPIASFKRIPKKNDFRSNIAAGSSVGKHKLTANQIAICQYIKPILDENGLLFVGIDMINDLILEINTTSPTGLVTYNKIEKSMIESTIWNQLEKIYS